MLDLVQVVSDYYFPETGLPNPDNILKAYVDLFGDVNFNAIGSVTARKMAEKVGSKLDLNFLLSQRNKYFFNFIH